MGEVVNCSLVKLKTFVVKKSYQSRSYACRGGGKMETILMVKCDTPTEVKK